jgi:hypothetical protein
LAGYIVSLSTQERTPKIRIDINGTAVPMSGVLFEIYGVSEIKRNGQYSGTFAGVLILLQASR